MKKFVRASGAAFMLCYLLLTSVVLAEWYTDPFDPSFEFDLMRQPTMCSDGENGAFFSAAFDSSEWFPWIGHVDRLGNLTYTEGDISGLLPLTQGNIGIDPNQGVTLIPSEPEGRVIAVNLLYDLDRIDTLFNTPAYVGMSFKKFDANGPAGFEQLIVGDTTHNLINRRQNEIDGDSQGPLSVISDGQGGLHLLVIETLEFTFPVYYNHLQADGNWTHLWPGILLRGGNYSNSHLLPDGSGGAAIVIRYHESDTLYAGEVRMQRFYANGHAFFEGEAVSLLGPQPEDGYVNSYSFEPGTVTLQTISFVQPSAYQHTLFKFDVEGTNLWETEGRVLLAEGPFYPRLYPDAQDGFFLSIRDNDSHTWTTSRYDSEMVLQSSGFPEWNRPERPSGMGGSYSVNSNASAPENSIKLSCKKWHSNMTHAWADSTDIMNINVAARTARDAWTITEDGGIVGAVCSNFGISFYRVSPEGILGELPSFSHETVLIPSSIELFQNYPNPFNPATTISFTLSDPLEVSLVVFDITGREVSTLLNEKLSSGAHSILLDAGKLASGSYFYTLNTGSFSQTRKMVLLK